MLLGMTYAQFVAALGGGMLAFEPPVVPESNQSHWMVSVGTNDKDKAPVGQDGFLDLELHPAQEWAWGFKPVYAVGVSVDGAAYASVGVRKDYRWGKFQFTPFIGPALYQQDLGGSFESEQLLQFRSGFTFSVDVTPNARLGLGMYHISNAQITEQSAEIDVTRVTLQIRY